MQTETSQELIRLEMQPVSSSYPTLGIEYQHPAHSFEYSPTLIRTKKDYYDSREEVPEGRRISLASEELAIQLGLEKTGIDPRKAEVFDDLFARNNGEWYAFQWTETGLRVPKGRNSDQYETDAQGRKYWPRIVLIGDQEVGEILVPEGNGRVVVEWNEVFGIPKVTSDKSGDMKMNNHTSHFYFDSNPSIDEKTKQYDVAVARGSLWHHAAHEGCLRVNALYERSDVSSACSFRQVQGSIPEIGKTVAKIDQNQVEEALLEKMRKDFRKMPLPKFQEKYKL